MKRNATTWINIAFAALWLAIMVSSPCLKATSKYLKWPRESLDEQIENRRLTPWPDFRELPAKAWGSSAEAWYDDHFAFRYDIIRFYKALHFEVFKSPVKRQVPGRGDWVFGRMWFDGGPGDVWPEVEDYMGVVKIDAKMIDDWTTLFEGRVAWAEAHGIHYLEVLPPMKSAVHPEKMLPMIAAHKRESCREDLRTALAASTAASNVCFLVDSLMAEVASGREVYYEEDHHENAYGCYCVYRDIVARLRELWFPALGDFPFYEKDAVPRQVLDRQAPGCWENADRRLVVSNPEMHVVAYPNLKIGATNSRFPHGPVCVGGREGGIYALFGHDSFLRYPFDTWYSKDMANFAIPVGPGFRRVAMMIFTRFTTPSLEAYISKELPDVIVEQFSEGRLQFGVVGKGYCFLDETMRRAAAWSHGKPVSDAALPSGGSVMALAVFDNVRSSPPKRPVTVELRDGEGKAVSSVQVLPGVRRAVFFGDVPAVGGLHAVIAGGAAETSRLEFRVR